MAIEVTPAKPAHSQGRKATGVSEATGEFPDLPPPGLMGRLPAEQKEALLAALEWEHDQPPNPTGPARDPESGQWVGSGRWAGPVTVPGPFRRKHLRNRVAATYLEEAIMEYHIRQNVRLRALPELLGYSYPRIIAVWSAMKKRALSEEGGFEQAKELREFIVHHLTEVVKDAADRVKENAAYGAVVIRACEALRDIEGLEGQAAENLDIEELAEAVRGRSPLLLETIQHSEKSV